MTACVRERGNSWQVVGEGEKGEGCWQVTLEFGNNWTAGCVEGGEGVLADCGRGGRGVLSGCVVGEMLASRVRGGSETDGRTVVIRRTGRGRV